MRATRDSIAKHVGQIGCGMADKESAEEPNGTGKPPSPKESKRSSRQGSPKSRGRTRFPVVGIGASAGGLEAFEQFFTSMPPDSGMAFVLVQHLDPTHKSILTDLIQRYTRMTVVSVEDGMAIERNWVYIIPPDRDMALHDGRLHLMTPSAPRGQRHPIDFFFRSLSQDEGDRAICIILSGTGSDGSLGMREIKGEGGMVMAQDPMSAKYDGMPRSAIATGLVDFILPPEEMPKQLIEFAHRAYATPVKAEGTTEPPELDEVEKILILLRGQTGHDFSYYKPTTIVRRIKRRMAVNQLERMDDYLRFVREKPKEADTLFRELLIGVTNFFRDPDAFAALTKHVIRPIADSKSRSTPIRVWVPGCSTGEEAYSIAILFREYLEDTQQDRKVQIFATDIDANAIEAARPGIYPESIAADVPPQFLRRFFRRHGISYEVDRVTRDMLVFAVQSVIKDPPFSKIDLISCRNLLIYMKSDLQKQVVPLFHYALSEGGYLFLGSSETVGDHTELFEEVDRKWKIFKRRGGEPHWYRGIEPHVQAFLSSREMISTRLHDASRSDKRISLREMTEKKLLKEYAPTCIITNEKYEILYTHGKTTSFLEVPTGEANWTLLRMAQPSLRLELTNALRRAVDKKEAVRVPRLRLSTDKGHRLIDLTVEPIFDPPAMQGLVAVVIQELPPEEDVHANVVVASSPDENQRFAELERELKATKDYLQATIEQLESSNEELTSTNEEMQSSNEELQSTNQELQTSKEELQSMNEELATVNSELETKIEALSKANNDLSNVMASTKIAIIFLDLRLRIQRFTPAASDIINMIDTDVGRPLEHIAHNLEYGTLISDAENVLNNLVEVEKEILARDGKWFLVRVRPYKIGDNIVDGVVMTFTNISEQKKVQEDLAKLATVADNSPNSVIITDAGGTIEYVNRYFTDISGYAPEEAIGRSVNIIRSENMDAGIFKEMWNVIKLGATWSGELQNKRKDGTYYWDKVSISPLVNDSGQITHFVGIQTKLDPALTGGLNAQDAS